MGKTGLVLHTIGFVFIYLKLVLLMKQQQSQRLSFFQVHNKYEWLPYCIFGLKCEDQYISHRKVHCRQMRKATKRIRSVKCLLDVLIYVLFITINTELKRAAHLPLSQFCVVLVVAQRPNYSLNSLENVRVIWLVCIWSLRGLCALVWMFGSLSLRYDI